MTKLIIEGIINDKDIAWKKCKCTCSIKKDDVENQHPIKKCTHCYCQRCEDSMPRDSFKVNQNEIDKNGNITDKIIVKEIKKITIKRSQDGYNSILGWSWDS